MVIVIKSVNSSGDLNGSLRLTNHGRFLINVEMSGPKGGCKGELTIRLNDLVRAAKELEKNNIA